MPRIALFLPALLLGAVIGCKDQYGNLAPSLTASPVSAGCAANPTVTAFDDTTLRAALKAARPADVIAVSGTRSEEHTSELQSHSDLVCRLLLEKKNSAYQHK